MVKLLFCVLPVFFLGFIASAQSNNVKIKQYTKADFNADSQFWAAAEGKDGTLFFGNNDGVVIFNGEQWQKIILPNNSSVRSLAAHPTGTIYVGGYNEAGTLQKNVNGKYTYISLTQNLGLNGRNIENIWDIQLLGNKEIYRAYNEVIITTSTTATHLPTNTAYLFSGKVGQDYYVQESGIGLLKLDTTGLHFVRAFSQAEYNNEDIAALLQGPAAQSLFIITVQGAVYIADTAKGSMKLFASVFANSPKDQVLAALPYSNGSLLIGTVSSKIMLVDRNGSVVTNPPLFSSLQESVIHSLFKAKNNNIWVMQNNGLAYIDFKSPYTHIFSKASVYDALAYNDQLYLATTQGIHYTAFTTGSGVVPDFKKINGLQGQAWWVKALEGDIIAATDAGLFKLKDGTATKIGIASGFWKVTPIQGRKAFYLASHYNGLYLLEKRGSEWLLHDKIEGFNESARDIMPAGEAGTYWVCHGYQGVFKIRINPDYTRISAVDHFTTKNGLKNSFNVNVSKFKGQVIFTTNTGIYTYNKGLNRFEPHSYLNKLLDTGKNTRKLAQHGSRTWFVQDDEAGYFNASLKNPELHKDLFLNLKGTFNRGMECILPLDDNRVLFGTANGLFLYTISNPDTHSGIQTLITQVSYFKNQQQEPLPLSGRAGAPQVLPNQTDLLRFDFAAPKMTHGTQVQYSYQLENTDEGWSAWQNIPYKEYTHLRPGTYTFNVRSRNTAGLLGAETKYTFTIVPKWYQTTIAYILYVVVGIMLLLGIRTLIKRRIKHERTKSQREAERTKKVLELEVEQLKLQRDKEAIRRDKITLEEDVINKSKELANYTLMLGQKKDIFAEITTDLKELKDHLRNEESRKKLLQIFQKLNQHKIGEEYMEVFDVNFEKVHHNFFEKLKELNPALTKRELRLCAFVKMNLSNKEISPLLGISLRGIENARYRIRKKLNVSGEDNFAAFLESIAKQAESA